MSFELQAQALIIQEMQDINKNLSEQNRLLSEFLKYTLRHEGDGFKRNESAKDGD